MNKNVYDIFRSVQKKRVTNYDERSAAFIMEGKMAKTIYHKRRQQSIKAALVFRHKEGPDEVLVYSLKKDKLHKSDYFVYDDTNYLVYEENILTDDEISYKKQKAVECNVAFHFNGNVYKGYFTSSVRRKDDPEFEGRQLLMPDENPLLILPTNSEITINSFFNIEGKPWNVVEVDYITNKGISYYYLERDFKRTIPEVEPLIEILSFANELEPLTQEGESPVPMMMLIEPNAAESDDITGEQELALRSMVEYTFNTEGAYFSATPKVEVVSRTKEKIVFKVPFGIFQVSISTKNNGIIIEKVYQVSL
jgi:hypothetical protein